MQNLLTTNELTHSQKRSATQTFIPKVVIG